MNKMASLCIRWLKRCTIQIDQQQLFNWKRHGIKSSTERLKRHSSFEQESRPSVIYISFHVALYSLQPQSVLLDDCKNRLQITPYFLTRIRYDVWQLSLHLIVVTLLLPLCWLDHRMHCSLGMLHFFKLVLWAFKLIEDINNSRPWSLLRCSMFFYFSLSLWQSSFSFEGRLLLARDVWAVELLQENMLKCDVICSGSLCVSPFAELPVHSGRNFQCLPPLYGGSYRLSITKSQCGTLRSLYFRNWTFPSFWIAQCNGVS